jgi:predicted Zn-dependent protease
LALFGPHFLLLSDALINTLKYPDLHHLDAAKGWLMLGDLKEAKRELDKISPELQNDADVLEARFAIYAKARRWVACMELAATMLDVAPDRPAAWINTAQTLHGLRQTRDAWEALYSIWEKFPGVPVIPYNLARYACRLGRLHESKRWLRKAFKVGGEKFRKMALSESDLKPVWALIKKL